MEEKCFFRAFVGECGSGNKIMTTKRIQKVIDASKIRGDKDITIVLETPFNKNELLTLKCHRNCIESYISEQNLKRVMKRQKTSDSVESEICSKRLRSSVDKYDSKIHCLYCTDVSVCVLPHEYDSKIPIVYRIPSSEVTTKDIQDGRPYLSVLLEKCQKRTDKQAAVVRDRLLGILGSDLVAVKARYHRRCQKDFVKEKRQVDTDKKDENFENLCKLLSTDKYKIWNSHELEQAYHGENEYEKNQYFRHNLIDKLKIHFEDQLVTLNGRGIATLVMFKAHGATAFRLMEDTEDDLEESIAKVSRAIKSECIAAKQTFESYDVHIDKYRASESTSDTLATILSNVHKKLEKYSLPSLMVGNIVAGCCTYQPTPLQIAFGVLFSGQKSLIDDLHPYGICCNYTEVRRWLRSAAVVAARDRCFTGMGNTEFAGLIQVIIDNFDKVINSINCKEECHVLAMMTAQSQAVEAEEPRIPRLSREAMKISIECDSQIIPYVGPKNPPMPVQATLTVQQSEEMKNATEASLSRARALDIQFLLDITNSPETTPEYHGFNTRHCRDMEQRIPSLKSPSKYNPLINAKPDNHDTVNTALRKGLIITQNAGQEILVITADMKIYKIIVDITFNEPALLGQVAALVGRMHFNMDYISAIGTLCAGNGLSEILYAVFGSVEKMLAGKLWPENQRALRQMTCELLRPILLKKPEIDTMEKLEDELEYLCSKSKTCKMWVDVIIKPTFHLMLHDRSDHEGDFALHLYAAKQMMPLIFAANKHNYARYGLYYIKSMNWLSPEMEQRFLKGEQALRLKDGIYNSIASDMFIECTWMRKGKNRKGYSIIGNTQSPQTVATWVHSQNAITSLTNDLRDMSDRVPTVQSTHKEEASSRMKRDQMDRENLREALSGCVDPLDSDTHPEGQLINICNGKVAPLDVNVHEAIAVGQTLMSDFERSWPEGFYRKMSMKITTFASKRKHLVVEGKAIDPEAVYLKAIGLLASDRPLDLKDVLAHELGSYPPCYFKEDGSMRLPSAKSELKKCLGVTVNSRQFHPTDVIVDFSAWVWTIKWPKKGHLQQVIDEIKAEIKELLKNSNVFFFLTGIGIIPEKHQLENHVKVIFRAESCHCA